MGNKKLLLETILKQQSRNDNEDDSDSESDGGPVFDSDEDSDTELQKAFAEGKLKPGIYGMVPMKRTEDQVNDVESLKRKLNEIKIFENNWLERLDMVSEPAAITPDLKHQFGDLDLKVNRKGEISGEEATEDGAQNDFKRELLFYRQAQTTAIEGIKRLHTKYGITKTRRPDDYFAEMAKSDVHMHKVRERLQAKQNSIDASEKAKKMRELKKYGKKVQQEVQLKRQQEKRELLQKIQNYKKGKEESLDFLDDDNIPNKNGGVKKKTKGNTVTGFQKTKQKLTKKQAYKGAKYGYGGQKKRSKYNSAESAANVTGFSACKHGRPTAKKSHNRPGKARRQNMRNRK